MQFLYKLAISAIDHAKSNLIISVTPTAKLLASPMDRMGQRGKGIKRRSRDSRGMKGTCTHRENEKSAPTDSQSVHCTGQCAHGVRRAVKSYRRRSSYSTYSSCSPVRS